VSSVSTTRPFSASVLWGVVAGCTPVPPDKNDRPIGEDTAADTSTHTDSDPAEDSAEPDDSGSPDDTADTGDEPDTAEPPPPSLGLRGLLVAQDWGREAAPHGEGAGQYRVIVLQESMERILPEVRASNPDARILAYQKVGGFRADGDDNPSTGIQFHEADGLHEDWFLHDTAGNRLIYCDYPEVWAANIGHPGYQQLWLDNVRDRLLRDGFDGVMMDDVNTFPGHCLGERGGTPIAEYPTDEAYGDAVVDFMEAVSPSLIAAGLLVSPNIAMNPWEDTMRAQALAIAAQTTHVTREYWMRWNDSENFTGANWESTLTFYEAVEGLGVAFHALTYGPGHEGVLEGQRFGRASFLLAWNGEADSAWGYLDDQVDPWTNEWAIDPGLPLEDRQADGVGWRRAFTGGTVLVNPHPTDSQTFLLDRLHRDGNGAEVSEVTLASGHAMVLVHAE
jgi:hypothetical protein